MSDLEKRYQERWESFLVPTAEKLRAHLQDTFGGEPRIDRIVTRAKDPNRFVTKARKRQEENLKYSDPLTQIQDQIGARIVTFYPSDVERLTGIVHNYYRRIEEQSIVPESESEFGYFGKHFILFLPEDILPEDFEELDIPPFFELQIKTLFQHAWGEAAHDLAYKPQSELSTEEKRKIAFTAAQAWGADMIFEELFTDEGG